MSIKRRLPAFLLALALCLGLFQPVPAAAAELYFTALNDTLLPLTSDTMPVWSGGTLYVPYSVFDSSLNGSGIKLGMECNYDRISNTVTLYTLKKMLVFDLAAGVSYNELTGERYSVQAITRNGRPYLPLYLVCSHFGLSYSYNAISQGYLVRIKNSSVVLSDEMFIDAAGELINRRLREYYQSLSPAPDAGSNQGTTTPAAPSEDDEPAATASMRVYLALRCESGGNLEALLDALSDRTFALFLLTPQAMESNPDLVRRILGTGHSVGILAQGETLAQTRELLKRGAALLEQNAHIQTTIACVPSGQRTALEGEGWVCWQESLTMTPSDTVGAGSFASSVLRRLEGRGYRTYLTLPGDGNTARVLSTLLYQLEESGFILSIPLETRL